MDLVNIIYRYVNRFINSEELINLLENIDKTKFSNKEVKELDKLLEEVKKAIETFPIEIDEVEVKRITSIDRILDSLKSINEAESKNDEIKEFIKNQVNSLTNDKDKINDCGPRYEKLYELLVNNSVYINYCENLNDLELLEFITQYISAPVTPNIDQETFEDLVKAGIKEDKRESLWRLAFNYNRKKKDFSSIEDYFISKRDDYYLTELISAVKEDLNMDKLIKKVINTKDKEFMVNCGKRAKDIGIFTDTEFKKLKELVKEKEGLL